MENDSISNIIPKQILGSQMDALETRDYDTLDQANEMYASACDKLINVNGWTQYAGISAFQLIDEKGVRADRLAQVGDYIRIDIPGPGPRAGMGYDWVRIEAMDEVVLAKERAFYITVRPCTHPKTVSDETAHFLRSDATSTFLIRQKGMVISAEEHGRNEMPNNQGVNFIDKGRNSLVGMAAKIGLSFPQWKSLVRGLLSITE